MIRILLRRSCDSRLALFGGAGQDPEQVGEAVEVRHDLVAGNGLGATNRHGATLGAANDGSGQFQGRGQPRLEHFGVARRAQLLGLLQQPASLFVRVVNAVPQGLVNVLQAKVRAAGDS